MNRTQRILARLALLLAAAVLSLRISRACAAELPMPDGRVEKYGCLIDHVGGADVMPAQMVHVWATAEGRNRWVRLLAVRPETDPPRGFKGYLPRVKPDTKARTRAFKDCDLWMAAMERRLRK